jgi:hypothetical protein
MKITILPVTLRCFLPGTRTLMSALLDRERGAFNDTGFIVRREVFDVLRGLSLIAFGGCGESSTGSG